MAQPVQQSDLDAALKPLVMPQCPLTTPAQFYDQPPKLKPQRALRRTPEAEQSRGRSGLMSMDAGTRCWAMLPFRFQL